ncbi:MAG: sodium-dependent transporter [Candidatus Zixiibacteriota bacterium]|nr:MAG: sodium-dependent transporter [candidate division Zixibacteria bacterium]
MANSTNSGSTIDTGATRGSWGTRVGFILAATGSAIGLGNIWKFPYITGVYGGGAFVLVYLVCVVIVGLPLMVAELMIGRRSKKNPVGAFRALHAPNTPWQATGWLGVLSGFVILSFYSVVAGWAMAYIFKSIAGFSGTAEQIQAEYTALVAHPTASIIWHTVFMVLCIGIVIGGVRYGIERWSKILMPTLFLILVGLMGYGLLYTDGGAESLNFLFKPNFHKLSAEAALSALGHAFFTLSLGMGAMLTYGSYMRRDESITRDAIAVSALDTIIALIAGIAIYSLVFSFNMDPAAGPGLIFQTLPVLFAETGPWVSVPFFVLLTFAALTSGISLLEVVVAYFIDERRWSRTKATLILGGSIWAFGLLSAIAAITIPFRGKDQGFFDVFDFISTNYMLPVGGLLTCLFAAWVMKRADKIAEFGSKGIIFQGLIFFLRFVTPLAVLIVLLHGLELLPFMDYSK